MNAEILSVGTELLLGNITNTDARDVSIMLSELGINVYWHTVVGDNPERLTKAVDLARSRADLIITTGGLGPTCDDLTKQVLAKAFGLEMYFDEPSAENIRAYFQRRSGNIKMTENNLQQAMLPIGCAVLKNDWGTAPGCAFEVGGTSVIMLPGPPRECCPMFRERAMPWLREKAGEVILSHSLRVFGEGESAVEAKLRDMMNELTNPTLAPYAKEGEVMLRVTAKAKTESEADALMQPVISKVRDTLGDIIYGMDVDSMEEYIFNLLRDKGITLAAAESCSGGLLAKRITDLPGSSAVFLGGVTVYTNAAKTTLCGVPAALIEEKTAVSVEVAEALATGIREKLGADLGVGITGVAGPDTDGVHDVGTVFVSLATKDGVFTRSLHMSKLVLRERCRIISVNNAFDMIRRYITGLEI